MLNYGLIITTDITFCYYRKYEVLKKKEKKNTVGYWIPVSNVNGTESYMAKP